MDRLWAPWRIDYVSSPHKERTCFLCEAAETEDDRRKLVLWRADQCLAVMNLWPYNNGHLLVAPLAHVGELSALSEQELLAQVRMIRRCRRNLQAALDPGGFNIGLNLGKAAGAGLPGHLHWHIVPRWDGDTNFMPVTTDTKVIPQSLRRLWTQLREVDCQ